MDKLFTIKNGTRSDETDLCSDCKYGHVIKGSSESQEVRYWQQRSNKIPFRVAECSVFEGKGTLSLWEMKDIAWNIEKKKNGKIGFTTPEERRIELNQPPKG